ncbi:MAG: DUF3078 domain-containing protein, partial [Rickettsiales bacterium]|nr:DUF3078 domain-containing protein [Rickettsiales bacterium]
MKKTKLLFLILLSLSIPSYAEEASPNENIGLRANFRRVALDYSKTNVDNAIQYRGSPITALNANNQSYFKGNLDFALEYEQLRYRWDNKIWANYGRTNIKTLSGRKTKSETADELIFTSDYSRKFWKLHNMDLGAFTSVEYQTEFTRNRRAPRNQVARGRLGMRLFNGKYITDLYATNVVEYDFTYAQDIYKYA